MDERVFKCKKCMTTNVKVEYEDLRYVPITSIDQFKKPIMEEERFKCKCNRCGYTWSEDI